MSTFRRISVLIPVVLAFGVFATSFPQSNENKVYAQHATIIPDFIVTTSTTGQLEYGDSDFQAIGRFTNVENAPIAVGQKAKVLIDELGNTWLNGQVTVADWSRSKSQTGSVANVVVNLQNIPGELQGALKPKMGCTMVITVANRQNVLAVPESAVFSHKVKDSVEWGVLVIEDSVAQFRPVIPGMVSDGFIEITRGLNTNELFVVGRPNAGSLPPITDGERVVVVERPKSAQGDLEGRNY